MDIWTKVGQTDRMTILAEKQKRHEGKSERGGGALRQPPTPPEIVKEAK